MPYLTDALGQTLAAQRQCGAEVVAVDGGSQDGSWEALQKYTGWTVRRQESDGLARARNEAIAFSSGEGLAFLDSDDIWAPEKLERQRDYLSTNPEADGVTVLLQKLQGDLLSEPMPAWTPSGCLFRKRVFDSVGGFDPTYRIGCDHEWFIRAKRVGARLDLIPECLLQKRIHSNNLSRDTAAYRRELFNILRSNE